MSLYDELPVFKASYDLLLDIFEFTANFKREYKYTVGEKLKNETLAGSFPTIAFIRDFMMIKLRQIIEDYKYLRWSPDLQ